MTENEGLVDLSLFDSSPGDDSYFSTFATFSPQGALPELPAIESGSGTPPSEKSIGQQEAIVDRTPDPQSRRSRQVFSGSVSISHPDTSYDSPRSKRKRALNSPSFQNSENLFRRRNVAPPPQLTISSPSRPPPSLVHNRRQEESPEKPSELVWMPEEQMWLVLESGSRTRATTDHAMPPAYSPQNFSRSEPGTRVQSNCDVDPPLSPVQNQLRSLISRGEDDRLSPLFQEAIGSIPMLDAMDTSPPPSYPGPSHFQQRSSRSLHQSSSTRPSVTVPPARSSTVTSYFPPRSTGPTSNASTITHAYSQSHPPPRSRSSIKSRLKPATSKFGIWTPNLTSHSSRAQQDEPPLPPLPPLPPQHSAEASASASGGSTLDFLHHEISGSSRSWHGFARKIVTSRPKSAL